MTFISINETLEQEKASYWNGYYRTDGKPLAKLPSQFAVFTLGELPHVKRVVELGCGNGRDSLFFARHGVEVTGLDASEAGIESCQTEASHHEYPAVFHHAVLGETDIVTKVFGHLPSDLSDTLLYARFFLHAVPDEGQAAFIELAKKMADKGAHIAVEFRTHLDERQAKVTGQHYRRFINPLDFHRDIVQAGLDVIYFVEGNGFAKYGADDAHVARFIVRG